MQQYIQEMVPLRSSEEKSDFEINKSTAYMIKASENYVTNWLRGHNQFFRGIPTNMTVERDFLGIVKIDYGLLAGEWMYAAHARFIVPHDTQIGELPNFSHYWVTYILIE